MWEVWGASGDRIWPTGRGDEQKCAGDLRLMLEKLSPVMHLYNWEYFTDKHSLEKNREKAYRLFLGDYRKNGGIRYVYTSYPESPFADKQFTVSLVSHFLFLYDEQLDYEFHKKTILELIRITGKEIRIFPIVNLTGKRSTFINRLFADCLFEAYNMSIEKVDYEFIKNGNEMLTIRL